MIASELYLLLGQFAVALHDWEVIKHFGESKLAFRALVLQISKDFIKNS
jgi:hypothetical protein